MDIESLRSLCLSLPGVSEDVKWENDLCFCVADKMFCVTGLEGNFGASLKVLPEDFENLIERDSIIPAPYLARAKWIYLQQSDALTEKEWESYVRQSYQLIKSKLSKRLQKEIEAQS